MSLIKKCDVKNYLSSRPHKARHPLGPVNKPGALSFAEDFSAEHSSSDVFVLPIMVSENHASVVVIATPRNPQE
jgi:hypothetical protein